MTRIFFSAAILVLSALPASAGDVSVSINLAQPGLYGQIDIGAVPRPPVIYAQPVIVQQAPEYIGAAPIYLHVPPGHEKHWSHHCAEYHACGRPVYFVRHEWYHDEYLPRHERLDREHERHDEHDQDHGRDHGHRDHAHEHDRDNRD